MPKTVPDAMLDAAFDYMDQADTMHLCSTLDSSPTYAEIVAASLASVSVTPDTDFTKADGDTSGRKVTVAAKNGVSVTATGDGNHIALVRAADSTVRYVTTCVEQTVTSGNTCNIPAWKAELRDPS
jgi:hypothetical protein